MPDKINWIQFQGKEILFNDRSNLSPDDIIANVDEATELIKKSGKKGVLYLIDNSNNTVIPKIKDHIKKAGKELDPYLSKSAVIGTSTAQKVLINILNNLTKMSVRVFDDLGSAKNWLIE